jgi:hypothetical protein
LYTITIITTFNNINRITGSIVIVLLIVKLVVVVIVVVVVVVVIVVAVAVVVAVVVLEINNMFMRTVCVENFHTAFVSKNKTAVD